MANSWLRLWHDMPNDPKWRTIARASGQSIALVQAVYLQLLVSASQNPVTDETGVTLHIVTVTNEDISSALDVTERDISSVTSAMQGRVLNGNLISGWDKRQAIFTSSRNGGKPAKSGAQRVKECRERKKQKELEEQGVTPSNVTVTQSNAVTTDKIREEDIRIKELKDKNLLADAEKIQPQPGELLPEQIFIFLPLNGKGEFPISHDYVAELAELYPAADAQQEFRNMRGWLDSNPTKRKTARGIKRFITTWLQKRQDNPTTSSRQVNYGQNIPGAGESSAVQAVRAAQQQWEQQQGQHSGAERLEALGSNGGSVWDAMDNEEWVQSVNALDSSNFPNDQ